MSPREPELSDVLSQALVEFLPDGLLVVDDAGTIVSVNDRLCEMFGYEKADLLGVAVEELVPEAARGPHTAHRTRFRVHPAVRTMGVGRTLKGRRRDGTELAVEVGLSPMALDDGLRVVAIVRDVSEQVALRARTDLIQQAIDATQDGVFMFDAETLQFVYVNEGAVAQTGYSRDELQTMNPLHIKPLFTEAQFRELCAPLVGGVVDSVEFETVHRRKDGVDVPVEIILEHPVLEDPTLARPLVAIVRDISERKLVEERLRASEAAFRRAFDDAPVAMAIAQLDPDGQRPIREVNRAFEKLFGYTAEEASAMTFADIGHPEDEAEAVAIARAMAAGREVSHETEKRYRTSDGRTVFAQVHSATLDSTGDEITVLAHIIDISDRRAAEASRDRFEQQTALVSRLRLGLLAEAPLDTSLERVCDDIRASSLASDAVVIELDDSSGEIACWRGAGETPIPVPTDSALARTLLDRRSEAATTTLDATADDLSPEDRLLLRMLGAHTVVSAPVADRRMLALLCSHDDDEHDLASLQRVLIDVREAVALASSRSDRHRMGLLEDRERIATDLHDVVIQRLFASGMRLQGALPMMDGAARERVQPVVTELDTTIAEIRDTIFKLHRYDAEPMSLSGRLVDLIQANEPYLGFAPEVSVDSQLDEINGDVVEQLVAVLTEMLSNVARHAQASAVEVTCRVDETAVHIEVVDNGVGIDADAGRGRGLENLEKRARDLGGRFTVTGADRGGTVAVWSAPHH